MDPFEIYSLNSFQGINDIKTENESRLTRAINIIHLKPKTLILGSSRVSAGFDKQTIENYSDGEVFVNAGIPGASFDEIYSYFLHALYIQPNLKKIILGIDFFGFNEMRKFQNDFTEERLQRNSYIFSDVKNTLMSSKALYGSIKTFYLSFFNIKLANTILEMGENVYLQSMLNSEGNYKNYQLDPHKIQKFQLLVEECRKRSIELKVLVCPVKAMYWEMYYQNDLWPILEDLKRKLCAIHPIWDFSGYNPITTETLPSEGNAIYHECSHFTSYTGKLLLKRMLNQPSSIDDIGYLLTPENMENSFQEILKQRGEWIKSRH